MKKLRTVLIISALIIITAQTLLIDYNNLAWGENAGSYLSIISMLMLIGLMIISIQNERKNKDRNS